MSIKHRWCTICIVLLAFVAANALGRSREQLLNAHLGDGLSDRSLNNRLPDDFKVPGGTVLSVCMSDAGALRDKAVAAMKILKKETQIFLDDATEEADNDYPPNEHHGYCNVEPYCDEREINYFKWKAKKVANYVTIAKGYFDEYKLTKIYATDETYVAFKKEDDDFLLMVKNELRFLDGNVDERIFKHAMDFETKTAYKFVKLVQTKFRAFNDFARSANAKKAFCERRSYIEEDYRAHRIHMRSGPTSGVQKLADQRPH